MATPLLRRSRATSATSAILLACAMVVTIAVPAASAPAQAPGETVTAADMSARADATQADLDMARSAVERADAEHAAVAALLARQERAVEAAGRASDDASRQVRGWAVAAYVSGGRVPDGTAAAVLLEGSRSIEPQRRQRMAQDVGDGLLERREHAAAALLDATVARDEARTALDESARRVEEATATRRRLGEEVAAQRAEAERLRLAEEAEAQRLAFIVFVRATTPQPEPFASGVVPPPVVPAEVAARLPAVPRTSLDAYWRAAANAGTVAPGCRVDWALLAAIGHVETGHGTTRGAFPRPDGGVSPGIVGIELPFGDSDGGLLDGDPFADRAVGPMQFIPTTWAGYASDGNGDGVSDAHNIYDASLAAAWYLCRNGQGLTDAGGIRNGVHAYNRSWLYVARVISLAADYRTLADG